MQLLFLIQRRNFFSLYTGIVLGTWVFMSCSNDPPLIDWVVGVYMAADAADLHDIALRDIEEMQNANTRIEVVVLVDRFRYSYRSDSDQDDWDDTRAYRIFNGTMEEIAIPELGLTITDTEELDMGSESSLDGFASYITKNYQQRKKFFVLWGHGDGYRSVGKAATSENIFRGLAIDRGDTVETRLRITDLGAVFNKYPIEIIGIDACIGANIELVYELRNAGPVLLASQENVRINGWSYTNVLQAIAASNQSVMSVSSVVVAEYNKLYGNSFPYSAILPEKSKQFAQGWNDLVSVLERIIENPAQKAQVQALLLDKHYLFPKAEIASMGIDESVDVHMDIQLFLESLQASSLIDAFTEAERDLVERLYDELEEMILVKQPDQQGAPQGVSIYLGGLQSNDEVTYSGVYRASDQEAALFIRETSWNEENFLETVFATN